MDLALEYVRDQVAYVMGLYSFDSHWGPSMAAPVKKAILYGTDLDGQSFCTYFLPPAVQFRELVLATEIKPVEGWQHKRDFFINFLTNNCRKR